MDPVFYVVIAWVDPDRHDDMIDWLCTEHLADVVGQPGVEAGWVTDLEQRSPEGRLGIMSHYRFTSRTAFDEYMSSAAKARFDAAGIRFRGKFDLQRFFGRTLKGETEGPDRQLESSM